MPKKKSKSQFDIGKVLDAGRTAAVESNYDADAVDHAVKDAFAKYKV